MPTISAHNRQRQDCCAPRHGRAGTRAALDFAGRAAKISHFQENPVAEANEKESAESKKKAGPSQGVRTTPARDQKHCREEGCKRPYRAKGYCTKHYRMWRQGELGKKQRYKICSKEGCRKPMVRWGLCDEHYKAAQAGEAPAAAS
jgi:hypothetical protein